MNDLLNKIASLKVLVVGDIMLDHYIIGDATRISPEAPVPVVAISEDRYVLGGSANVACNLASIGANVEICGLIGNDFAGDKIIELFSKNGIKYDNIFQKFSVDTILKTRVLVRGQQLCRLDREQGRDLYDLNSSLHMQYVLDKISENDILILSDYAKGVLSSKNVQQMIDEARKYGKFVALDPKPKRKLQFKNPDLMTPNLVEACELADAEAAGINSCNISNICKTIYNKYFPHFLVITLGSDGMLLCENGEIVAKIPTYAKEVFDVSGAGDTSVACLSAALGCGSSLHDAAHFANIAAGIVVGKVGTATVSSEEILNFYIE